VSLIYSIPLLILTSILGYQLLKFLNFPASRIIGPILMVAIVQLLGFTFQLPAYIQPIFSVIFGVNLGLKFNRTAVKELKRLIIPAITISTVYIFITVIYGNLLMKIGNLDQRTAFLSVIPGGVAEASVLAVSFDAVLAQVSAFQLLRYLSIVMIIPVLTKSIIIKIVAKPSIAPLKSIKIDESDLNVIHYSYIWLYLAGTFFAVVFKWIHFPAALMLGATFGVAVLQNFTAKKFSSPPLKIYEGAQLGMGAIIGMSFTQESLVTITSLWFPMLVMTLLILSSSILLAFIFSKLFKLDYITGLMSVLPGGLSTMIVLAEDFDANLVTISTLQLARLLTAVAVIPLLYARFL
jgi:uncharacterized protein